MFQSIAKQRNKIRSLGFAINYYFFNAFRFAIRILNFYLIDRAPEFTGYLKPFPICWDTWINSKSIVIWLYAQDLLRDSIKIPGSGTCEP